MQLWSDESKIYAQVLHRIGFQKAIRQNQLKELEETELDGELAFMARVATSYAPENAWRGVEAQLAAYANTSITDAYNGIVTANLSLIEKARANDLAAVREALTAVIESEDDLINKVKAECAKIRKAPLVRSE
jgi:hypothetical protein